MDRKKDEPGNFRAATRRVTTENAPGPDFCETRKAAPGVWTVPSYTPRSIIASATLRNAAMLAPIT